MRNCKRWWEWLVFASLLATACRLIACHYRASFLWHSSFPCCHQVGSESQDAWCLHHFHYTKYVGISNAAPGRKPPM